MSLSRPWLALVLALFCLPLFVGLGRADIENDEAIYSFGVDRLLESGDWLAPKSSPHEDAAFLEKPPLKFWIVAAPIHFGLLPHNEFGMRFWDALFGGLALAYVFAIGSRLAGPVCGAVAALVLFVHPPLLFEHGLRTNNMEAALVLAHCGVIFHYIGWSRAGTASSRRKHAVAVGLYFVLGFMTKFVAALFLPLVLALATLVFGGVRRRLFRDWRLWGGVIVLIVALSAPWFIYAQQRFGPLLWDTMLREHVYNRFTSFLDPAHVHPWYFYVAGMFRSLGDSGSLELTLLGLGLLAVQTARKRWFEGFLVLAWLVLPISLMSLGTSKLYHYAYPFLPPLALSAGYLIASAYMLAPLVLNRALRSFDDVMAARYPRLMLTLERPAVSGTLLVFAAVALGLAVVSLVYGPIRIESESTVYFRSSGVLRPALAALAFGVLAGAGRSATQAIAALFVASLLPLPEYRNTLARLTIDNHPMRTASDCLQRVEAQAGEPRPGLYLDLPQDVMSHGLNYYFRRVRPWQRAPSPAPAALEPFLEDPAQYRPMLVYDGTYQAFMHGRSDSTARARTVSPPMVSFPDVVLLLPGPYAACGDAREAGPGRSN
jgi:4-amino-4-deoxy-L-arabinose transferase-like glycosyltransferase